MQRRDASRHSSTNSPHISGGRRASSRSRDRRSARSDASSVRYGSSREWSDSEGSVGEHGNILDLYKEEKDEEGPMRSKSTASSPRHQDAGMLVLLFVSNGASFVCIVFRIFLITCITFPNFNSFFL